MIRLLFLFLGTCALYYFTKNPMIVAGVFFLVFALLAWGFHLDVRAKKEAVHQAFANIEDALVKRYDLLTKMFEITKGYVSFKKDELAKIGKIIESIKLSPLSTIDLMTDAAQAQSQLRIILSSTAPSLRDPKSAEVFERLSESALEAEENLSAARRFYNFAVGEYNTAIRSFPVLIITLLRKTENAKYFEISEPEKRNDVNISFE